MKKSADTPDDEDFTVLYDRAWDTLIPARANYLAGVSPHYDEVFHDVVQRTERAGSLGKTDIAALVVWKRLSAQTRWGSALMSLPEAQIRSVAERAVTAVRDTVTRSEAARTGRSIIWELPGFRTGDALASAVLTAAAPQRMAVYDQRVQHTLDTLGLTLTPTPGRYGRYLQLLDDLLQHGAAHTGDWTARDIDTALYWTGSPPGTKPLTSTNPHRSFRCQTPSPAPHHRYQRTLNSLRSEASAPPPEHPRDTHPLFSKTPTPQLTLHSLHQLRTPESHEGLLVEFAISQAEASWRAGWGEGGWSPRRDCSCTRELTPSLR
ncbi:hypothetical protein NX794_30915 [Streptomyces sp. LP11]|uniref:DUF222 domain-containing protein n=1 Tax=Streptomyces pyxinicus TaxID=2970331 RepID=A0ABT2BAS2_9ACTN|nr:hypothetical protein [Streptomyces sp. LP11]MCS0605584.1 hypothetical protein [Streptomyces sp. LP11]